MGWNKERGSRCRLLELNVTMTVIIVTCYIEHTTSILLFNWLKGSFDTVMGGVMAPLLVVKL